ncbi:uncharacterized protein FYW47_004102 [Aplochiton taeniatus]
MVSKVRKTRREPVVRAVPHPCHSDGLPHRRPLPSPLVVSPAPTLELSGPGLERIEMASPPEVQDPPGTVLPQEEPFDVSPAVSMEALNSSQDEERPISPFYMSNHLSPVHCRPDLADFLERTISSAVERHLFEASTSGGQSSEDIDWTPGCPSPAATPTARQRRRRQREQQAEEEAPSEAPRPRALSRSATPRAVVDKENVPSCSRASASGSREEGRRRALHGGQGVRPEWSPRKASHFPTLALLTDNQDAHTGTETTMLLEVDLCQCVNLKEVKTCSAANGERQMVLQTSLSPESFRRSRVAGSRLTTHHGSHQGSLTVHR